MDKIYVKGIFCDWVEVSKEMALSYVEWLMKNLPGVTEKETIAHIESKRLRGITVEELGVTLKEEV